MEIDREKKDTERLITLNVSPLPCNKHYTVLLTVHLAQMSLLWHINPLLYTQK